MFTQNNVLIYKELKEQYPKALYRLVEWVHSSLMGFQKVMLSQLEVEKETISIPEVTKEHAEKATEALLTSYPRSLFDFFDLNKIFLTTDYIFEEGFVIAFAGYKTIEGHLTRIEAEMTGIKAAFATLETQL